MKLKEIELKENERLFVGYFNNYGREYAKYTKEIQSLAGWAFKSLQLSLPELKLKKVKGGYASEWVTRKFNLREEN